MLPVYVLGSMFIQCSICVKAFMMFNFKFHKDIYIYILVSRGTSSDGHSWNYYSSTLPSLASICVLMNSTNTWPSKECGDLNHDRVPGCPLQQWLPGKISPWKPQRRQSKVDIRYKKIQILLHECGFDGSAKTDKRKKYIIVIRYCCTQYMAH